MRGRLGIVDIGSNTIRLVVYDMASRLPIPMFNEKSDCRLGEGLGQTGRLNPGGVDRARRSIARFVHLSRAMGVKNLHLVATAAVREAEDGPAFVREIQESLNVEVEVVSGAEESRLAALGILYGDPDADGMLGDLGGGSLDLIAIDQGKCGAYGTFPLGHLRLYELSDGEVGKARKIAQDHLQGSNWLSAGAGRTFYAVGGSMRALARLCIEQTGYPLHIVDNYSVSCGDMKKLAGIVAGLSEETLQRTPSISSKRATTLPMAAVVLELLLDLVKPGRVVFSGFGMREGKMISRMPKGLRKRDPAITACEAVAKQVGRFAITGEEIRDWTTPLFPDETPDDARRRYAASLLSDIGWNEHPDYRAEHAFLRCLRLPIAGLTHEDRAFLATAIYVRYGGNVTDDLVSPVQKLIDEPVQGRIAAVGRALRLAHTVAGSAPGLLASTRIEREDGKLVFSTTDTNGLFASEAIERRLKNLARELGLEAEARI